MINLSARTSHVKQARKVLCNTTVNNNRICTENRPFTASHSRGTNPPRWREKVALGQDKQRQLPFKIIYVFCLSCPSATFALQRGSFVPREWLAAKGPFSTQNIFNVATVLFHFIP